MKPETYITVAWLPDGRQGWDLVAEWRNGTAHWRVVWGTYATFERAERNLPHFTAAAERGPDQLRDRDDPAGREAALNVLGWETAMRLMPDAAAEAARQAEPCQRRAIAAAMNRLPIGAAKRLEQAIRYA